MKRLKPLLLIFIALTISACASTGMQDFSILKQAEKASAARPDSKKGIYFVQGLTGGASGDLDSLDITGASTPNQYDLIDGDAAIYASISGTTVTLYHYVFDADGTDAESSPDIIRPDDYSTGGVWRKDPNAVVLGSGLAAALAINVGSAGAPILYDGAGGTPSAITLTNGTGLPISTGVAGLGTGVAAALAINVGSAGAPMVLNGAGGTPSAIDLTNATNVPVAQATGSLPLANLATTGSWTPTATIDLSGATVTFGLASTDLPTTGNWTPSSGTWDLSALTLTIPGLSNGATSSGFVRLYEDTDNGTSYTDIIGASDMGGNRTLTLPDSDGTVAIIGGDVWTGVHDFGGATSVEVPNSANPTTDAAGEVAVDSDDEFIEFYGTASRVLPALISETFSIVEPDTIQGITDDVVLKHFMADAYPHGVTIKDIAISASSAYTSEVFLIEEWDDRAGSTQSTVESITISSQYQEDDGTLSDAAIAADAFLVVNLDDTPEDIAEVEITVTYYVNPGD